MRAEQKLSLAGAAGVEAFDHFLRRAPENVNEAAEKAAAAGWAFVEAFEATVPKKRAPPKRKAAKKEPAKEPVAGVGDGDAAADSGENGAES